MICIDLSADIKKECCLAEIPRTVLALGNFDGVHIGHCALLQETVSRAKELSLKGTPVAPGVWLFKAPPSDFLRTPPIPHLSSTEQKLSVFKDMGIRYAFLGAFEGLSSLSPRDFAVTVLQENCHCVHAVCGFNYSFGYRGEGTPEQLSSFFEGAVSIIPSVAHGGIPVSSTRIRTLLAEGEVRAAAQLLGRPYSITLPVLHGKALGRTIDFPTANQNFPPLAVVPKSGIYAVEIVFPWEPIHTVRYGVANVGLRPTVEHSTRINCETYIFDFSGDLYGKEIEIRFIERLRDERKMSGIDELKETIENDACTARRVFGI